jgi:hypothetical protein
VGFLKELPLPSAGQAPPVAVREVERQRADPPHASPVSWSPGSSPRGREHHAVGAGQQLSTAG